MDWELTSDYFGEQLGLQLLSYLQNQQPNLNNQLQLQLWNQLSSKQFSQRRNVLLGQLKKQLHVFEDETN